MKQRRTFVDRVALCLLYVIMEFVLTTPTKLTNFVMPSFVSAVSVIRTPKQ